MAEVGMGMEMQPTSPNQSPPTSTPERLPLDYQLDTNRPNPLTQTENLTITQNLTLTQTRNFTITWIPGHVRIIEILNMHKIELRKTAIIRLRYGKRTETGIAMYLLHRLTVASAIQSLL